MNKLSKVMLVSVITNIFLALSKLITGIIFSSGALLSDGIHSFSDLTTDIVAIIGNILARKPADQEHPYGHGKIEYLTSLIVGIVVVGVGAKVIHSSIYSNIVIPTIFVAAVSLITIILKLLLSSYIINEGNKMNNNILIASGKESRMDVISSLVVFISILFMQLSNYSDIFKYSDKVASIIVGLFIIKAGIDIIRENASVVLGKQETNRKYINNIKKRIKNTEGVVDIKSFVMIKYGHSSSLNLVITMDGNTTISKAHEITDVIEEKIRKYSEKIEYINIHVEPE